MGGLRKILILQIILAAIAIIIVIIYLLQRDSSMTPYTKVYLTNTSIIGKVLGVG